MKTVIALIAVFAIFSAHGIYAQGDIPMSTLIAAWKGSWTSNRYDSSRGIEIQVFSVDKEKAMGQVKFSTSNFPPCSYEWEKFLGDVNGEKVSAQVDLGGQCGKVSIDFQIDPKERNIITGTYAAEYPDTGSIRLKRR